jgi:hypothetical protein
MFILAEVDHQGDRRAAVIGHYDRTPCPVKYGHAWDASL